MKYKIKTVPCSMYDTESFENWLGDMAESGWQLDGLFSVYALFKKAEPAKLKYRLEPKEDRDMEQPYQSVREMYESFGWEYICKYNKYGFVWKGDESLEEIHTDPGLQSEIYKKVLKDSKKNMVSTIILAILFIIMLCWLWFGGSTPVLDMVENTRTLAIIIILLIYPAVIVESIMDYKIVKKLYKKLENGENLTHKKRYSKHNFYRSVVMSLLIIALISVYILPFYGIAKGGRVTDRLQQPEFPVLLLENIEGKGFKYDGRFVYDGQDWGNFSAIDWSPLCPEKYEIQSCGRIFGKFWPVEETAYDPRLEIIHYDLLFDFLAEPVMRDLQKKEFKRDDMSIPEECERVELHSENLDEVYMIRLIDGYYTRVFARKDDKVVCVFYHGMEDITAHLEDIAAMVQ